MTKVVVIDYNMGNTDSVVRAIEKCDGNPILSNSKSDFTSASHIILPGVGAFKEGMENIKNLGLESILQEQVLKHKKPFLGICLGMQLLADKGFENGEFRGLGWIEGDVKEFEKTDNDERIPHIGWNEVNFKEKKYLFENVISGKDMYFVHSYHFVCKKDINIIATTPYCGHFVSAVRKDNIFGVQFHPEKSQKNGFKILKNFLSIA
jgi:imidazole glycerol-phosphate synthase subunit HisH